MLYGRRLTADRLVVLPSWPEYLAPPLGYLYPWITRELLTRFGKSDIDEVRTKLGLA